MAVTNGYCTLAELRTHLGDTGAKLPTADLERAINSTSRAINNWTGRRFWQDPTVTTRTYRPKETSVAWVEDISTKTGLIIQSDTGGNYSYSETWTTDDYDLYPSDDDQNDPTAYAWWRVKAVGTRAFITSSRRKTLKVTARFGWSGVPEEVNQACLIKASSLFSRRDAVFGIAGYGEFGPVRITRRDPDVIELLDDYVKIYMGAV